MAFGPKPILSESPEWVTILWLFLASGKALCSFPGLWRKGSVVGKGNQGEPLTCPSCISVKMVYQGPCSNWGIAEVTTTIKGL